MNPKVRVGTEEVENLYSYVYDRPKPYNYEPARQPGDQEQTRIRRNNSRN